MSLLSDLQQPFFSDLNQNLGAFRQIRENVCLLGDLPQLFIDAFNQKLEGESLLDDLQQLLLGALVACSSSQGVDK